MKIFFIRQGFLVLGNIPTRNHLQLHTTTTTKLLKNKTLLDFSKESNLARSKDLYDEDVYFQTGVQCVDILLV